MRACLPMMAWVRSFASRSDSPPNLLRKSAPPSPVGAAAAPSSTRDNGE